MDTQTKDNLLGNPDHNRWRRNDNGYSLQCQNFEIAEALLGAITSRELVDFLKDFVDDEPGSQEYPTPLLKLCYPDRGNFIAVVSILNPTH